MGSRLRRDVRHLYECYCEVSAPSGSSQDDSILIKYPVSYRDEELKTVPQFAFPCEAQKYDNNMINQGHEALVYQNCDIVILVNSNKNYSAHQVSFHLSTTVQHFSFVLTNLDSKWTFGFCRQAPNNQTAHIILSYLPWHELFYKILDHIAELLHDKDDSDVTGFLEALYARDVPDPGTTLHVSYGKRHHTFTCRCPNTYALPSIPENRNLTEYFNAVDSQNMMIVFASMLHERRIVMTSSRVSRLTASIQAANAVIYPMNWQHIFIPVLPVHLLDYLLAPMPFLIGVPRSTWERVRRSELGDAVVLDVDTNRVETPFNDLDRLPPDIVSSMRRRLKTPAHMMNDGVARVFLRALVQLIGGYRDALRFRQGEQITFCRDAFLHSRPPMVRPFLESMLQLQIFQQFIEERLEMLNSGQGFSDEFELEACLYSDKSSNKLKQQYKEWLTTMNKKSGAIFKQVKSKANPAMRNAVKTVKEQSRLAKEKSRTAYKDFRLRFKDMQVSKDLADSNPRIVNGHELCSASSDSALDKPRSAPSSPKLTPVFGGGGGGTKRATHHVPDHSASTAHALRRCETSVSQHYHTGTSPAFAGHHQQLDSSSSSSSDNESHTSTEDDLRPAPLNMDLMEDLKNVIFRSTSFGSSVPATVPVPASAPAAVPPAVDRSRKPSLCTPPVSPTRNEGSLSYPVVSGATPLVAERGLSSSSSSVPLPLPPPRCRKRSNAPLPFYQQGIEEDDLIHLEPSSSAMDEFDPLSSSSSSSATVSEPMKPISNPLYPYHNPSRNGTGYTSRFDTREDPFSSLLAFTRSNFGPAIDSPDKSQAKPNWTTFE